MYISPIAKIDRNVGRILDWLDAKGIAENTFVIFFSDHGDMLGQHDYYCGNKRVPYRGSMQVPVIARYPGRFPAGHVSDCMIDLSVDTMPTVLQLCSIPCPEDIHGRSFLPLLQGEMGSTRDSVMYELIRQSRGTEGDVHPTPRRGIRTKDWLYVREPDGPYLLFDLRNDPHEETNLVGDPRHSETMAELDRRVTRNMMDTGDDWDPEHDSPPPDFVTHEDAAQIHGDLLGRAIVVP